MWDSDCQEAFDKLKRDLTSSSIPSYPKKEEQYVLDTDASNMGMGSVIRYSWNLSNTGTTYLIIYVFDDGEKYCTVIPSVLVGTVFFFCFVFLILQFIAISNNEINLMSFQKKVFFYVFYECEL